MKTVSFILLLHVVVNFAFSVENEFIVKFKEESWIWENNKILLKILREEHYFEILERNNFATEKFTTDFSVIKIFKKVGRIVEELEKDSRVKSVTKQYDYSSLLQVDENVEYNFSSRILCSEENLPTRMKAHLLWERNYYGQGVNIGVFDTGIKQNHKNFKNVKEIINFTDEKTSDDYDGHGTFVTGIISSKETNTGCPGFAPDANLYIFKVYNQIPVAYTSWFLDAFNYALKVGINVINLSIGGPDYMDRPFVEKVVELVSNGVIFVSAIGNKGPNYGTLHNPADMNCVLGVGGITLGDEIAYFSSRGTTTKELKFGYGSVKPDFVTYGVNIKGTGRNGGCIVKSGTSVSSPVITGVIALLSSVLPENERWKIINPASMKQILMDGASRIPNADIFEQGMGKINIINSLGELKKYKPKFSFFPEKLDLVDCPYMNPFCFQPIFHTSLPLILNVTILNGFGVVGEFVEAPKWIPKSNGKMITVNFSYDKKFSPYSGHLGVHISVTMPGRFFQGVSNGAILAKFYAPKEDKYSTVTLDVRVKVIRTPPRSKRILWDQYHNIQYPPDYVPRDSLSHKEELLDWFGDHPHTNFRNMFLFLRERNYFVEVLTSNYTTFDARNYGTLMVVDIEEEFTEMERQKLKLDIRDRGLSVVIFADWYNVEVMEKIKIFDDNTQSTWTPVTGGANLPSINALLDPYGIAFGDGVYDGEFSFGEYGGSYFSGSSIVKFPRNGYLGFATLEDQKDSFLKKVFLTRKRNVPIFGLVKFRRGKIVVFGDSNCLDTLGNPKQCFEFLDGVLKFASFGRIEPQFRNSDNFKLLREDYTDEECHDLPKRPSWANPYEKSVVPAELVIHSSPWIKRNVSRGRDSIFTRNESIQYIAPLLIIVSIILFIIYISKRGRSIEIPLNQIYNTYPYYFETLDDEI